MDRKYVSCAAYLILALSAQADTVSFGTGTVVEFVENDLTLTGGAITQDESCTASFDYALSGTRRSDTIGSFTEVRHNVITDITVSCGADTWQFAEGHIVLNDFQTNQTTYNVFSRGRPAQNVTLNNNRAKAIGIRLPNFSPALGSMTDIPTSLQTVSARNPGYINVYYGDNDYIRLSMTGGAHEPAGSVFYIGTFTGMNTPADTTDCGASPDPCATLEHWTQERIVADDVITANCTADSRCIVRLAPGTYSGGANNCILGQDHVRYEGRAADDTELDDNTSVVISAPSAGGAPCDLDIVHADCDDTLTRTFNNFWVRDVHLSGTDDSTRAGVRMWTHTQGGSPQTVTCGPFASDNVTVDRVRVTNAGRGIWFNDIFHEYGTAPTNDNDCVLQSRLLTNLKIIDSFVDESWNTGGGIVIGCSDGVTIARNEVNDSYGSALSYSDCQTDRTQAGCSDNDGYQMSGAINWVMEDNVCLRAGEDCYDFGGHNNMTYEGVARRNFCYQAGSRCGKHSGGSYAIDLINNIFICDVGDCDDQVWGSNTCNKDSEYYNNVFWHEGTAQAIEWTRTCTDCVLRNNVFYSESTAQTIELGWSTTSTTIIWDNNLIENGSTGLAINENQGQDCTHPACGASVFPACADEFAAGMETDDEFTMAELATFQSENDAGRWFGDATDGNNDVWNTLCNFIDEATPQTAGDLHLDPADTVCIDAGSDLSTIFATDFDNELRPKGAAWDIGADEVEGL